VLGCCSNEISETLDALKIRKYALDIEDGPKERDEISPQNFPEYDLDSTAISNEELLHESEVFPGLSVDIDFEELLEEPIESAVSTEDRTSRSNRSFESTTSTRSQLFKAEPVNDVPAGIHHSGHPENNGSTRSVMSNAGNGKRQYVDMEKEYSGDVTRQSVQSSTSSNHQSSGQRRLVSYVSHAHSDQLPERSSAVANERELRTGEIAVELVIEYERSKGRNARSMAHQNAGFDVIAEGDDGKRFIEVKGTEAAWGERGVYMTPTQFFYARENPNRDHWLYVVEGVRSSSPKIHMIHNPSIVVDRFVFDGGWKQIADSDDAKELEIVEPSPGDEVYLNGIFVGIVEAIRPFGKFPLVLYRDLNNIQQRKRLADITVRTRQA
jgi:hypothetical protein